MSDALAHPAHGRLRRPENFRALRWLPGPHLPTIWASEFRAVNSVNLEFERLELPDGDFVDLATTPNKLAPAVIVLHGLEGSHQSSYARAILAALHGAGFWGVLLHFRGCSGEPNRLARTYHSGDTADLAYVVQWLEARTGVAPFAAIGYSLGGNVLLKWLAEENASARLETAVAVSVPFDLAACADRLNEGFSRIYQRRLVKSMQDKYLLKFKTQASPLGRLDVRQLKTFWDYDDQVTAPLHGFRDVHDYYGRSSSRQYLSDITIPTLILHARDDPFVPAHAIPEATELGAHTALELVAHGGHVGFVSNQPRDHEGHWLERRICSHLRSLNVPRRNGS